MAKTFFDSEISVYEHSVRASNIIHNSSLIMGKQIINVLPEGSVLINPASFLFFLFHLANFKLGLLP